MDRIIFGDNQFFGVNHLSEEKARRQAKKFEDITNIYKVLDYVNNIGIKSFMVTTYSRVEKICNYIRDNDDYKNFKINPCLPYAHKYANAVAENGILGTLKKYLKGNIVSSISKGSIAYVKKDFIKIMEILVDAELSIFKNTNIEVVFLQNVISDLLLGLGMYDFFGAFNDYINNKYGVKAGYITMNMPWLLKVLKKQGIEKPIICASLNKINFRVSGGLDLYEKTLREEDFHFIAMQVLAAGAIAPKKAFKYVAELEGVDSILFGSSNPEHILESKNIIEKYST
jgi:hypothetical protein